jgi:tetratricopeptide (TPR) repeat protein
MASASGERSVTVGGNSSGIIATGDHTRITQAQLGPLRPIGEVPSAAGPIGVPGVGVFVGRDGELAELRMGLTAQAAVVVQAVAGLGGIGKSTLAARYVSQYEAEYAQVVWVTADSRANLEAGLAGFAVALEPQLAQAVPAEGLVARAMAWLASHERWLLVLDNVTNPALVRDLLPRLGSGHIVVTTRRVAGWAGVAKLLRLDVLSPEAAHELVALTVESAGTGTGLLAGVEVLCERLGFLPLGLEQAAAYMAQNHVTASEYLELLDAQPAGMFADAAVDTPEERTLARVWAVSLDALADEPLCGQALRVLAWLSPDGVPRRLLAGLADQRSVLRAVGRLAAYSMLTQDEAGTVTVHRLVQAVARAPQDGDPHRAPTLVDQAREAATGLLHATVPSDAKNTASWPAWRELAVQVNAFFEYAPERTDTVQSLELLDGTASFLANQGSALQAVSYLQRALVGRERQLGTNHPDCLESRNRLAVAWHDAGDDRQAVELLERTVADSERLLGTDHPTTLASRNNLALAYRGMGEYRRAIELHERALADSERLLGADHLNTLSFRNNLALACIKGRNPIRAVELLERSVADRTRVLGADHPDTLQSRSNLVSALQAAGDRRRSEVQLKRLLGDDDFHPDEGAEYYRRAIDLGENVLADSERLLGIAHPNTLNSRSNLAVAYGSVKDYRRAIALMEQVVSDDERGAGADHPYALVSRHSLAHFYAEAGDHRRAAELLERTLADMERVLGSEHPDTRETRDKLRRVRAHFD